MDLKTLDVAVGMSLLVCSGSATAISDFLLLLVSMGSYGDSIFD